MLNIFNDIKHIVVLFFFIWYHKMVSTQNSDNALPPRLSVATPLVIRTPGSKIVLRDLHLHSFPTLFTLEFELSISDSTLYYTCKFKDGIFFELEAVYLSFPRDYS